VIVGVDFGAPRRARDQRRKLVALAAEPAGPRAYRVAASGMNARVLAGGPPGWSAAELVEALLARPARAVGLDFPFSVPDALLADPGFAADAGHAGGAFGRWEAFNACVAARLPLEEDPLDLAPFARWRDPARRARLWTRRATDLAAGAQPPLKDRFQATFQMTLLGNAVLARLRASGRYRVRPFDEDRGEGELLEVYPGATLRALGLPAYKARPAEAMALALAACARAGLAIELDPRVAERCLHQDSGTAASPDHDLADALVALCTTALHAEDAARDALPPGLAPGDPRVTAREGAIRVPALHGDAPGRGQTGPTRDFSRSHPVGQGDLDRLRPASPPCGSEVSW
jgi:hypothetical protein